MVAAAALLLSAGALVALDPGVPAPGGLAPTAPHEPASLAANGPRDAAASGTGGAATSRSAADARIAELLPRRLARLRLRGRASVVVSDLDEGHDVIAEAAGAAALPASLAKLATAVTALTALGPAARFPTTLLIAPDGSLVLQGGGDPLLSATDLRALARTGARALPPAGRKRPRRLLVDDSTYDPPTPAPGWAPSYDLAEASPVRALRVDGKPSQDAGLLAGRILASTWSTVTRGGTTPVVRRARTPRGSRLLARVPGHPVSAAVRRMLQVSDNDIAEALARQVALAEGYPASWRGAEQARVDVLARLGVPLAGVRLADGSGLSRSDRMTVYALAALLRLAVDPAHPELAGVSAVGGLPIAGRTGSLRPARGRFVTAPSRCATGRLWAKTGLLHDVVGLAGYTRSTEGHLEAFVILVNGPESTLRLRQQVDALAATVTGCW